jgi:hypothetical protein
MSATLTGSNLPTEIQTIDAIAIQAEGSKASAVQPLTSNPGFFCLWKGNGNITLNINCGGINAASNVMISLSEYSNAANPVNSRFMGAAKFAINNVCPRAGGVVINMDITWSSPLMIYISILIS